MIKIECPFHREFGYAIKCPYLDKHKICSDIECGPGNGDAWCGQKIGNAIDREMREKPGTTMRQNYSCDICGLKSFVTYDSKEDGFDVVIKIEEDHKRKEPTCPNPLDDLNIVGEPIEV